MKTTLGTAETTEVAQMVVDSSTEEAANTTTNPAKRLPKGPSPSWFRVNQMVDASWLQVHDMVQYFNQQHKAVIQRNTQRASARDSASADNSNHRPSTTKIRRKRRDGKTKGKGLRRVDGSNLEGPQQPEAVPAKILPSPPLPNLVEPEPEQQEQQQLQETPPPDLHLPLPTKDAGEDEEEEEDEDEVTVDPPSPPPPLLDPGTPQEEEEAAEEAEDPRVPSESESHGQPRLEEETPFDERSTGSCPPSHKSVVSVESLEVSDEQEEEEEEEEEPSSELPDEAPVKNPQVSDPKDEKQQQEPQEPSPQSPDTVSVERLQVTDPKDGKEQQTEQGQEPDGAPKERLQTDRKHEELDVATDGGLGMPDRNEKQNEQLQARHPLPDLASEKRRVLEELGMNSSIPGIAWNLVESAHAMQTKDIQTLAADGIVLLVERLLQTQAEFRRQNAPCFVDIAYHHTQSVNLKTIQTEGLLSRSERAKQRIRSRNNGSTYGDGVYCSSDPVAFAGQHFGDTTILLARIKGNNSVIVPSKKLCVLHCGSQCVPLFRFPSKLLGSEFAAADAPTCQFRQDLVKFQEQVQSRLLDKFFNKDPSLQVKGVDGVHLGWGSDRFTPGRSALEAFLNANRGSGNTVVTNAAVVNGQTMSPSKIKNTDTSMYDVYVRPDGKKVRRLKKNLIEAALGKEEIYIRADGTKVRRVKRTTASATAEKPKALTEFRDIEIYTRPDGKKVRRIRKAPRAISVGDKASATNEIIQTSEGIAIARPNNKNLIRSTKPPQTKIPTQSSSGCCNDPYIHNFPSMLGLSTKPPRTKIPTQQSSSDCCNDPYIQNFPSMLGLEPLSPSVDTRADGKKVRRVKKTTALEHPKNLFCRSRGYC